MVPIPEVASLAELNEDLLTECLADDRRRVGRQPVAIGEAWEMEKPHLLALAERDFDCCVTRPATRSSYSQVVLDTNRYYGFFSPGLRSTLASLRQQLEGVGSGQPTSFEGRDKETQTADQQTAAPTPSDAICCPTCGKVMQLRQIIQPKKCQPP